LVISGCRCIAPLAGPLLFTFSFSLCAQAPTQEEVLPLPLVSATSLPPAVIDPLTPKEKLQRTLRQTVGIRAIGNRLFFAGFDQLRDSPEEWPQGLEGFGQRVGNRYGSMAIRNSIQLTGDLAFRTEPRYDRCDCIGAGPRSLHAVRRMFVARRDLGGEVVNVPRLAAAYVTPMITHEWLPARYDTTSRKLLSGTSTIGFQAASNLLREFWPDIQRKFRRK